MPAPAPPAAVGAGGFCSKLMAPVGTINWSSEWESSRKKGRCCFLEKGRQESDHCDEKQISEDPLPLTGRHLVVIQLWITVWQALTPLSPTRGRAMAPALWAGEAFCGWAGTLLLPSQ